MSIHNEASFQKARRNGAMAAYSRDRWAFLTDLSKRQLAELVVHLASLATDSYDETILDDALLIARIKKELAALTGQGLI
jgi:hypothetical protein